MADEEEEGGKAKGGGTPIVLVALLLVNTLVAVASLALTVMGGGGAAAPAAVDGDGGVVEEEAESGGDGGVETEEEEEGALVPMDTITLQLRNPEMPRYMRLDLQIEVPSVDEIPKVDKKMAPLRDAFIKHLADQTYENMRGSSGLDRVKAAIKKVASEVCGEEVIKNIYVTNFVVQ